MAERRGPIPFECYDALKEDNALSLNSHAGHSANVHAGVVGVMAHTSTDKSDALLALILSSLEDDKAEDIVQIDLRGRSEMGDHMVICSGRSSRQVTALAEKLVAKAKEELGVISKLEGKGAGDWVLIDTGDVIVHVFRPEVREFYQLEKMWLPAGADTPA